MLIAFVAWGPALASSVAPLLTELMTRTLDSHAACTEPTANAKAAPSGNNKPPRARREKGHSTDKAQPHSREALSSARRQENSGQC